MSRFSVTLLALLLVAVPLLGEAACDDCVGERLGAFCASCSLCLCCGRTWATRPDPAASFFLRPCGTALAARLTLPHPPAPREILHIPLVLFA